MTVYAVLRESAEALRRRVHAGAARGVPTRALGASVALLLVLLLTPGRAAAVGTPANTAISNQARADYVIGGTPGSTLSAVTTFFVNEVIDVVVVSQDAGPVASLSPSSGRVLTFLVQNVGNGREQFAASFLNLPADDFDALAVSIYVDVNGDGLYTGGTDPLYVGPADLDLDSNDPANDRRTVFLVGDIPPALANGDVADLELTATAVTGTGAPGSSIVGAGDGGTDALFGASGGDDAATGTFLISDLNVSIAKSVTIFDPLGGSDPTVGALLRYRLDVSVTGTGTAVGIAITDPIPANTTYTPATLRLNSAPLTDVGGDDAGDVGATTPGEVTVSLGDLTSASPIQTITFDVTIN